MTELKKIISGGQTGADRAALDAALECQFEIGGFCPKGRKAEDGVIDKKYPLVEIDGGYEERTLKNVLAADITAIFYNATVSGGTAQTLKFCKEHKKPFKLINIASVSEKEAAQILMKAIDDLKVKVLNVAGPRASGCPEMYGFVKKTIILLIGQIRI